MQHFIASTLSGRFSGVVLPDSTRESIAVSADACATWVYEFRPEIASLDGGRVLFDLSGFFGEAVTAPEFLFGERICGSPVLLGVAIAQRFLDGLDG